MNTPLTRLMMALFCLALIPTSLWAQSERKAWSEVVAPSLQSWGPLVGEPQRLALTFALVTGTDGADKAVVELLAGESLVESRTLGKSKNDLKTVEFVLTRSGTYRIRVGAYRNGEAEPKRLTTADYAFSLPLAAAQLGARNLGGGTLLVSWPPVAEATEYEVILTDAAGQRQSRAGLKEPTTTWGALAVGSTYSLAVVARRGTDQVVSPPFSKRITQDPERVWNFTQFGQSSNANVNKIEMLDAEGPTFRLLSATALPNGQIENKGGKFTTFHDGISFFYTVLDPKAENFELTATFTLDFINPVPDGQEGFGLLVMDSLGAPGVSAVNHYTNSVGLIATKFEGLVEGVKRTSKDTLGARFVSGITGEVLALGDSGIAQYGRNVSTAFGYETADLVKTGESYTLTLKKTNTGYHVVYRGVEQTFYGAERLAALDADHDYVGFAAARGCNVTVSDVKFTLTDPQIDAPAREEPPILVPLAAKVDSAAATGVADFPFVFTANATGTLTVEDSRGISLAGPVTIAAGDRFGQVFPLVVGQNDFTVQFSVDPAYSPAPKARIAEVGARFVHTVYHRTYAGPVIHVAPNGSSLGLGTPEKPVNLAMALSFARPGQTIELAEGTYRPRSALVVERGNNGTAKAPIRLVAGAGERPVLDFEFSTGGMLLWGDYWVLEGFDVTATPGNVKGLQVGGNNNVLRRVNTYLCGDTGLQISGNSADPRALWPSDNLIQNCTSWGNNDPAQNNADGFAAKLTCGTGNVFRGCIAFHNIDDGWDLFSKIESGPIGAVTIENCVAYKNGSLPDGSGNGDGNGFKLGGDGISVAHVLRSSIAFDNGASGITSNSDPAVVLENNTSVANKGANINLYGKGSGPRLFQARGNLSLAGGAADVYKEMPELASPTNYFWTGAQGLNSEGRAAAADWFVKTDVGIVPDRNADGSIDMRGLFVLTEKAAQGVGAGLR